MRNRFRRALGGALLLLLTVPMSGCEFSHLKVMIPDFESSLVEGVQLWRLAEGTDEPVRAGRLVFSQVSDEFGNETIDYTIELADGTTSMTLPASLNRNASQPDSVELELYYIRSEPAGWFKVSTYNAFGSSQLSLTQTYL